jgi:hypothetical protein
MESELMLSTCYKLALENKVEYEVPDGHGHLHTCKHVRRALNVYGSPESFGLTTPIELSDILERVGVEAALWSLRAVYREQVTTARRIARSLAMDMALEGAERFPGHKLYDSAWDVALNYMEGDVTLKDLQPIRRRVFDTILPGGPLAHYGLLTWIMLSENPERCGLEILRSGIRAGLKGEDKDSWTKGEFDVRAAEIKDAPRVYRATRRGSRAGYHHRAY